MAWSRSKESGNLEAQGPIHLVSGPPERGYPRNGVGGGGRGAVRRVDTLGLAQVPARFRANFPGRVSCHGPSAFTGPGR